MQSNSTVWNSNRPVARILDPRRGISVEDPRRGVSIEDSRRVPLAIRRPNTPTSPNGRKYRPISPISFSVSPSDPIVYDNNTKYDCESVFDPMSTKVISAIPQVLSRWNEQPAQNKITFEWKKKMYQLLRKNETKVSSSQTYHKVYILEKEYKEITSPNGICIKAEEWKEISSFYIKIYDENLPYNGEFYL